MIRTVSGLAAAITATALLALPATPALADPPIVTVGDGSGTVSGDSVLVFVQDSSGTPSALTAQDLTHPGGNVSIPVEDVGGGTYIGYLNFSTVAQVETTGTLQVADGDSLSVTYGVTDVPVTYRLGTLTMTVVGDGPVGVGKTVQVSLDEPFLDTTGSPDTDTATISSSGGGAPFGITLTETGATTHVFQGTFQVGATTDSGTSPPTVADGTITVQAADGPAVDLDSGHLLPCHDAATDWNCIADFSMGDGFQDHLRMTVTTPQPGTPVQFQLKAPGQVASASADTYDLAPFLTAGNESVDLILRLKGYDAIDTVLTASHVDTVAVATSGGNSVVTIAGWPGSSSWVKPSCPDTCGDDAHPVTATDDYGDMFIGAIDDMASPPGLDSAAQAAFDQFRSDSRGSWIASNAQDLGSPSWNAATGALSFQAAAPHFKRDGVTLNDGFFDAFVPRAVVLDDFGFPDTATATADLQTTRTDGASTSALTPSISYDGNNQGFLVSLGSFHYSSPTFSIGKDLPTGTTPNGGGGGGGGGSVSPTSGGAVSETVPAGGTVTSDSSGTGPTSANPVVASVTTPNGGTVSIAPQPATGGRPGYSLVGSELLITAPPATPAVPIRLVMTLDAGAVPPGAPLAVFRDGQLIRECTSTDGSATPDPCVLSRATTGGDVALTILTSHASTWAAARPTPGDTSAACPAAKVPGGAFGDVNRDDVHAADIDCLAWWKISNGTGHSGYAPATAVTRGQLASMLARALTEAGVTLPEAGEQFADVAGSVHAKDIERLAALGVVQGLTTATFGPDQPITREQMASLLVRAYETVSAQALPAGSDGFTDVASSSHASDIAKIATAGFTSGSSATTFSPAARVTREQMATFLTRMLATLVASGFVAGHA